ncbi:MAG: DMT family transporter [Deltaproteobacteria bacterium]|nr:DMT family transporter [Deltaproteobacteria bacterium]MBW2578672.1 DMT family transporter [Deltaproteobacteria bacterium]MBW2692410.1 DMT family transporter [Deltaproteobacteria bacterium]
MRQQRPLIDWFGLLALAVLWGTSFLFVKIAVREVPPLTLVAARFVIAASVLGVAVRARGLRLPTSRRVWGHYLLMSLIGNSIPFTLIAWGQIEVDVGLAGILMGVTPLMTLLLAHFFVLGERMTPRMVGGFVVGFIGLVALFGPEALLEFGGESSDLLSQLAIGLAAICYATNTVITRRLGTLDPLVSATTVMWITTAIMVPAALWLDRPWNLAWSATSIASVVWLGLFATALATIVFFSIVQRAGPTFLSLISYMIPVVALAAGAIVLDEKLVGTVLIGMALILTGLAISQLGSRTG